MQNRAQQPRGDDARAARGREGVNSLTAAHLQPGANPQLQFTDPLQSILAGSEGKKEKDKGQRRRGGRSFLPSDTVASLEEKHSDWAGELDSVN